MMLRRKLSRHGFFLGPPPSPALGAALSPPSKRGVGLGSKGNNSQPLLPFEIQMSSLVRAV